MSLFNFGFCLGPLSFFVDFLFRSDSIPFLCCHVRIDKIHLLWFFASIEGVMLSSVHFISCSDVYRVCLPVNILAL